MSPHAPFTDRHALVTGGSRGIGAAIARALADGGARLTLLGRDPQRLRVAAQQLGRDCSWVAADVTDAAGLAASFAAARERHGEVHILVNNAGQAESAPIGRTDAPLWERMLAVNLTGAYLCIQQALPWMLAAGQGPILNGASTAGLVRYDPRQDRPRRVGGGGGAGRAQPAAATGAARGGRRGGRLAVLAGQRKRDRTEHRRGRRRGELMEVVSGMEEEFR